MNDTIKSSDLGSALLKESTVTINTLNDFHFFVEDYQRGYKWGVQQVQELLTDIHEFNRAGIESFYCLQPVVVKTIESNSNQFELIDGQQRLTTIFIILQCLNEKVYELIYRTRESSELFLNNINLLQQITGLDVNANIEKDIIPILHQAWNEFSKTVSDEVDNVDNFHFFCAYQFIKSWLQNIKDLQRFKENLLHYTRVIWHEQTGSESAERVFIKFNQGKIELAQAELIKALFILQINEEKNIELRSFKLNQFAEEWNSIENQLQDDSFWFFVSNDISDNRKSNRIDLLFDLVKEKPSRSNNKFYSYHLYLSQFNEQHKDSSVQLLNWGEVRDLFNQLLEWYHDRLLYHLIGFIVYEQIKTIAELNSLFHTSADKVAFVTSLKKTIKDYFYPDSNKDKYDLESISYGSNNAQITSWLVLHNVVNYHFTDSYYRFPFERLKLERGWSLEHIHAQNSDKLQTKSELLDWITDIKKLAEDFADEDSFNDETLKALEEKLKDNEVKRDSKTVKELESLLNDEVSTYFQKDSIRNLCLLDRRTNSSIGNKFFTEKRNEILKIDRISLEEYNSNYKKNESLKPFIPLATKHVFLKYFTKDTNVQMTLWGAKDREDYLKHIESSIIDFLNTENQ